MKKIKMKVGRVVDGRRLAAGQTADVADAMADLQVAAGRAEEVRPRKKAEAEE